LFIRVPPNRAASEKPTGGRRCEDPRDLLFDRGYRTQFSRTEGSDAPDPGAGILGLPALSVKEISSPAPIFVNRGATGFLPGCVRLLREMSEVFPSCSCPGERFAVGSRMMKPAGRAELEARARAGGLIRPSWSPGGAPESPLSTSSTIRGCPRSPRAPRGGRRATGEAGDLF
jgi:hypothetical protein